ncbi:MAG TPA: NAD(P)-binding domain-containing protein [Kofleriaceae bacterium]|nr:NAD(P)-binding domain-containing protein [Kofleriaceae bacterium]
MSIQKVTIVGTGAVGMALAKNLVRHDIDVQLAARDLAKTRERAASLGERASVVETGALRDVGVLLLAVPAAAAAAALEEAKDLAPGTIVVDCTNPLRWSEGPVHTPPAEGSITAQLAAKFPRLRLVKAFNTFGAEFHERPEVGGAAADLYVAGDDAAAKQTITELARTMGFDPVDVGPLRNAAHLESLAMLWIHLATVGGQGRQVAFKLLRR